MNRTPCPARHMLTRSLRPSSSTTRSSSRASGSWTDPCTKSAWRVGKSTGECETRCPWIMRPLLGSVFFLKGENKGLIFKKAAFYMQPLTFLRTALRNNFLYFFHLTKFLCNLFDSIHFVQSSMIQILMMWKVPVVRVKLG